MGTASTISVAQLLSRYPQYPVGYGSGVWSSSAGVLAQVSGVNYFFALTTTISPYRRQLLFDS